MQSNGGLVSPKIARHYPIRVVGGPAAGVLMGGVVGERVGKHIITFDMGGQQQNLEQSIMEGRLSARRSRSGMCSLKR